MNYPQAFWNNFSVTIRNSNDKLGILYHSKSYFLEINLNARYTKLKNLTKLGEAPI